MTKAMQFMNTCYNCRVKVKAATIIKEGIKVHCLKCPKCKEEYFTSSELDRFDMLRKKKSFVRKFGKLGASSVIRVPPKIVEAYNIHEGDYGVFEKRPEGVLIKLISAD